MTNSTANVNSNNVTTNLNGLNVNVSLGISLSLEIGEGSTTENGTLTETFNYLSLSWGVDGNIAAGATTQNTEYADTQQSDIEGSGTTSNLSAGPITGGKATIENGTAGFTKGIGLGIAGLPVSGSAYSTYTFTFNTQSYTPGGTNAPQAWDYVGQGTSWYAYHGIN